MSKRNIKLFSHQKAGIEFALKNDGICAFFWEPGLGKTRGVLEVYKRLRLIHKSLKLLVVCPLSLVNAAWGEDIKRFTDFKYAAFKDIKQALPDIVIINYEALISKRNMPYLRNIIMLEEFMCVLDESSRLKNHKSLTSKTLISLSGFFKYRIISSGTPMPNSELELWAQMNFLNSGMLHSSFYAFRNRYFHLERNGRKFITNGSIFTRSMMRDILSQGWKYSITPENRSRLMDEIRPLTHWVKKQDALDLPEKIDQIREVELTPKEKKAYLDMKNHLVAEIKGKTITANAALTKLMKLRQASSGFFYAEDGTSVDTGASSKLKELEAVIEELGSQQVIIWCQFHYEVEAVCKLVSRLYGEESAAVLYSKTKDKDTEIQRFKDGRSRYLIAHPKSAGHGLTFTNASTMIFYSLDYSYESHFQARERIHRIGQRKSCLYIYLKAEDTIDEQLLKVLNKKQSIQDAVYELIGEGSKTQGPKIPKKRIPGGMGI